jgi:hypothetical protein
VLVFKVRYEVRPTDAPMIGVTRGPRVYQVLREWTRLTAEAIAQRAANRLAQENHVASGALAASIHTEPEGSPEEPAYAVIATGSDILRGPMWEYAAPVETGGRPHRPPIAPIAAWAALKTSLPERELYPFVMAVVKKIQAEGTPATRFMSQAIEDVQQEWASASYGSLILEQIVEELTE